MTPEPTTAHATSVSFVALMVALFGPNLGPHVTVVAGAVAGAFWALAQAGKQKRWQSALLILRCLITSIVLTAFCAKLLSDYVPFEAVELYVIVAFVISALGDKWLEIFDSIKQRVQALILNGGGK